MSKFFIILALICLAYLFFKKAVRPTSQNQQKTKPKTTEAIVPCAHCGLHVPKSECVSDNDLYFCSDAHREAFLK